MTTIDRKEAVAAYKKRDVTAGIYALRCAGRIWVGHTPDLSVVQNRLRFSLRMGSHPSKDLQAAWNDRGTGELVFEALERFDPEDVPAGAALQSRLAAWRSELNALPA